MPIPSLEQLEAIVAILKPLNMIGEMSGLSHSERQDSQPLLSGIFAVAERTRYRKRRRNRTHLIFPTKTVQTKRVTVMDTLRKVYPLVLDGFLQNALNEADGDELVALELLRIQVGEPNTGRNKWESC